MKKKYLERYKAAEAVFNDDRSDGPCCPIAIAMALPHLYLQDIACKMANKHYTNNGAEIYTFDGYNSCYVLSVIQDLSPKTHIEFISYSYNNEQKLDNIIKKYYNSNLIIQILGHSFNVQNGDIICESKYTGDEPVLTLMRLS